MSDAQRFWTGERRMAVFWTVLLGLAGGVAGSFLVDRGSLL